MKKKEHELIKTLKLIGPVVLCNLLWIACIALSGFAVNNELIKDNTSAPTPKNISSNFQDYLLKYLERWNLILILLKGYLPEHKIEDKFTFLPNVLYLISYYYASFALNIDFYTFL